MNRHTDIKCDPHHTKSVPLPPIDWSKIGREEPREIKVDPKDAGTALPKADVVVMTWTASEWSALDHVFLASKEPRCLTTRAFEKAWHRWDHKAPKSNFSPLWGYYRLVEIPGSGKKNHRVLLFKSNSHLAHPPWITGLSNMVAQIIEEAQPNRIYSIGTAGAASIGEKLGDTVVTNSGQIKLQKSENIKASYNDAIISGNWYPDLELFPTIEKNLLFPMSDVVTQTLLGSLLNKLHQQKPMAEKYTLEDFLNSAIDPKNLHNPKGLDKKDMPLLTTDFYYIEENEDAKKYCVLEMDDTVVGYVAKEKNIDFAFFRNISDTVVPGTDQNGEPIPKSIREDWSGLIYEHFGLYTSMNGALLTLATIIAD